MANHKGFTLMECLIVIMMFGILSSMAVPVMGKWMANNRFIGGVDHVRSSLALAKLTALKESSNVLAVFNAGTGSSGTYRVFIDDGGGSSINANNNTCDSGERIIAENFMPREVTLASASFGAANSNSILFNPSGLPMVNTAGAPSYFPGSVVIGHAGKFHRVRVTAGGVIKIEKSGSIGGPWIE